MTGEEEEVKAVRLEWPDELSRSSQTFLPISALNQFDVVRTVEDFVKDLVTFCSCCPYASPTLKGARAS